MTQTTFNRILVAVDGSKEAQKAFHYAIQVALDKACPLRIASVFEASKLNVYEALDPKEVQDKRQAFRDQVASYKAQAEAAGLQDVQCLVAEGGDPAKVIIKDLLAPSQADLLIIGSHGDAQISDYFGSHATYLVKHAPIPVLVFR